MSFLTVSVSVKLNLFIITSIFCLFILTYETSSVIAKSNEEDLTINIGAIVHVDSRVGREQKTAMEIAVEDFNANSNDHKLSIHFKNGSRDPLQSAFAAQELIQENQAKVIIGTGEWQETALLAEVGKRLRVPSISLLAPAISPPFVSFRWPKLIQMARVGSDQIQCIADLVSLYQWRRVIVIYENAPFGGDSGSFSLLSKALVKNGSRVEYELSLPPLASVSNPEEAVKQELSKLVDRNCYSRVFIALHLSQTLASHLFVEAKEKGLIGKESVWLLTESIVDYFPSLDSSTLVSMEGALGLKTDYSKSSESFKQFEARFKRKFSKEYPEEQNSDSGFHTLLAYDAATAIGKAANTSEVLPEYILSTNFTGLSGQIYFKEGKLAALQKRSYKIVNVVKKNLVQVDMWDPEVGFTSNQTSRATNATWPGGLNGVAPKGWMMPTKENKIIIGIPTRHAFQNFVHASDTHNPTGFCIELFNEAVKILGYDLPHIFQPFNGTYDELVDCVYNKVIPEFFQTFGAAVGDFTALANRTDFVEFTQPFAESGLAMILPVKPDYKNKGWIFVMPFKIDLWIATFGILIYTMFIVWFLEHKNNPAFRGPWKDQLSTALWFTFSSLFFAQREGVRSSYTRVVMVVWFFVVLILTQSYTADLSSMLTVARLKQNETDIETLLTTNATVGCHYQSFTKKFLKDVLKFQPENILGIETDFKYFHSNFTEGNMTAAFLEIPYAKIFESLYCNDYTMTVSNYRFGGLSFVFPKGSPISIDVSKAILNLTEHLTLTKLENTWLNATSKCLTDHSDRSNSNDTQSLQLKSFWGLFVLSGATSTICLLGSLIPLIMEYRRYRRELQHNSNDNGILHLSFASYVVYGESRNLTESVRSDDTSFSNGSFNFH